MLYELALEIEMLEHRKGLARKRVVKFQSFHLFNDSHLIHKFREVVINFIKLMHVNACGESKFLKKCLTNGWHQDLTKPTHLIFNIMSKLECAC